MRPFATTGLARKAAVNQVLAGGATPHFIKEFLGHENLNTQNHYTDAAAELQKRQMAVQLTRFENVGRPDYLALLRRRLRQVFLWVDFWAVYKKSAMLKSLVAIFENILPLTFQNNINA